MTRISAFETFRSPNFALLWAAQVVSGFGDKITVFTLAYVTWRLTGSALSTAFAVVIATVPYAIFGFFGGAIADAVGHRRAMIACDVVRMVVIALIPALLLLDVPLAFIYVLVFVAALCSAVFNPARLAIIPELVARERLAASNSVVYASDRTVEIAGTLLAGVLVALLAQDAFYVDAATFGLSALLLGRIALVEPPARAISWARLLQDVGDGLRVIRDHQVLRANTAFSLLAQLSLPLVNGLTPVLVFREYGLGPEHYAGLEAAIAVGAVVAGLALPSLASGVRKGRLIVGGFAAFGATLVAVAFAPGFAVAVPLFFAIGVANVVFFVPNVTLSQELTPAALRARVFGSRTALLHLSWLPVVLAGGLLAETFDVPLLLGLAGGFTLITALVGLLLPIVRDAD